MKIKIIRTTVASGKRVEAGKSYDVSDRDADILTKMGKAVIDTAKPKKIVKKND